MLTVCSLVLEKATLHGKFKIETKKSMVKLSWPKPSGIYTKQVIERWKESDRSKTDMPCEEAVNCNEYSMSGLVTGLSLVSSIQGYTFKLVLYNGDLKVGEFYPDTIKTTKACKF